MKHAAIIGAGVGGLATAIRLSRKGFRCTVYEASDSAGGKLKEIQQGGYRFDAGPSLFTLPNLIQELYPTDEDFQNHFPYEKLDRSCHYFWEDGTKFVAWNDPKKLRESIKQNFKIDPDPFMDRLKKSKKQYELLAPLFIEKSLHKASTFLNSKAAKAIANMPFLNLGTSMNAVNEKLNHPKLVQIMNRYATYNGSDPFQAPGVLNMIPHLEFNIGTFFPKNGMIQIQKSLKKLADDVGVKFEFNSRVERILHNEDSAQGVQVNGQAIPADLVVSNADVHPTYHYLLPELSAPKKHLDQERSSSALIFYWGVNKAFQELHLHNIFFAEDYQTEFQKIFQSKTLHDDPTVYVNITSKMNSKDAPEGCENWFVMINVPATDEGLTETEIEQANEYILDKLSRNLNVNIREFIQEEAVLHPKLIEQKTSSYMGSLYGTSSNNRMSAFMRHPNFHPKLKGLYFAGGSVHPGGGIPLCLSSAKIIEELVD